MPSDNTWIFYLFTHSLLCSCSCLNHSTYIAVFTSSSAPHCSVLSSQAFPIPSPLNHFKAFLSAPFNMKSPWATISVVEEGWICAGLLTPSHTCSCFEQHQVGHRDDWQQAQNRNVKLKSTGLELEIMGQPDWTETSNLCALRTEQKVCHWHRHTHCKKKEVQTKEKAKPLKRPQFWSSGLNMLLLTQAGIYLKNRTTEEAKEAPDPGDHKKVLGRTKRGEEGKDRFLKCKIELVANKWKKNA